MEQGRYVTPFDPLLLPQRKPAANGRKLRSIDLILIRLEQCVVCLDEYTAISQNGQLPTGVAERSILKSIIVERWTDETNEAPQFFAGLAGGVDLLVQIHTLATDARN